MTGLHSRDDTRRDAQPLGKAFLREFALTPQRRDPPAYFHPYPVGALFGHRPGASGLSHELHDHIGSAIAPFVPL